MSPFEAKHSRFRPLLLRALVIPFLALMALAAVLLWQIDALIKLNRSVEKSNEVIRVANAVQKSVLDRETGFRGYRITGQEMFLEPYHSSEIEFPAALTALESAVGANRGQKEQASKVRQLIADWDRYAFAGIGSRQGIGSVAAGYDVQGKLLMDSVRQQMEKIVSAEEALRKDHVRAAESAVRRTVGLSLGFTIFVAVVLGIFSRRQLLSLSSSYADALLTARLKTQALQESSHRFAATLGSIGDAVIAADRRGRITFMNPIAEQLTGWKLTEVEGRPLEQVFPVFEERTRRRIGSPVEQVLHSGRLTSPDEPIVLISRNGREVPIEDTGAAIRDINARVTGIVLVFRDVTERRGAEAERSRLHKDIDLLLQSTEEGIFGIDTEGRCTFLNQSAEIMLGYKQEELRGRDILSLVYHTMHTTPPSKPFPAAVCPIQTALKKGQPARSNHEFLWRKDGSSFPAEYASHPLMEEGAVRGAVVTFRDITDRQAAMDALLAGEKFAASGRMASAMAHEVNNPLEAVTNLIYLLHRNISLDETARNFVRLAQIELDRVVHIVRETLVLYRENTTRRDLDLVNIAKDVLSFYAPKIQKANVKVRTQFRGQARLTGISGELRQIFANLLMNSIDAMPQGGEIALRISPGRDPRDPGQRGLRILFTDNGTGIPEPIRKKLFVPFFSTKLKKGHGLGLWVMRGVIEKQGGTMRLRSCDKPGGSYTAFSIFLPAKIAPAASGIRVAA